MNARTSRRLLQIATSVLAAIPIATGMLGLTGLADPLYVRFGVIPNIPLDSNLRFFSGIWLGAGFAVAWLVPRIERETTLFRVIWGMIFLGGIGRLLSLVFAGAPPPPFLGVLALEVLGAPLFLLWQRKVARDALATQAS